jgi:cytochrome b subunit of formate dehydrogenase
MERCRINYWIDIFLIVCLIVVGVTGFILLFAFVSGEPGVGRRISFLGTNKSDWLDWHSYFGFVMVILMLTHLILHWNFVKCQTKELFSKKT